MTDKAELSDDRLAVLAKRMETASGGDRAYERPCSWEEATAMINELLRLRRSPIERERVEVKPLEWVDREAEDEGGGQDVVGSAAQTAYPQQYWTSMHHEEDGNWRLYFGLNIIGRFATEAAAKAAAQADLEKRILSALSPSPKGEITVDEGMIERARVAIRYLSHPETPWSDEQVKAVLFAALNPKVKP